MDARTFWSLAYVSVLSIRLHPRNAHGDVAGDVEKAIAYAKFSADQALLDYEDFTEDTVCRG